jgi:hypothetical protein
MAADKKEEVASKPEVEEEKEKEKAPEEAMPTPDPPLEAAARRLERLLGGGMSGKDHMTHMYSNPSKVVKRWLGTSSGATGKATLDDISSAASALLDPSGHCATGREVILKAAGDSMDAETETSEEKTYLSSASEREVESWLISLTVRLLWKDKKIADAFELSQKGVSLLMAHFDGARVVTRMGGTVASLFPLLARMYRYRSLVAESITSDPNLASNLRQDMVRALGMASLRRDVDTQGTLLNLMLHDLLNASQGT